MKYLFLVTDHIDDLGCIGEMSIVEVIDMDKLTSDFHYIIRSSLPVFFNRFICKSGSDYSCDLFRLENLSRIRSDMWSHKVESLFSIKLKSASETMREEINKTVKTMHSIDRSVWSHFYRKIDSSYIFNLRLSPNKDKLKQIRAFLAESRERIKTTNGTHLHSLVCHIYDIFESIEGRIRINWS